MPQLPPPSVGIGKRSRQDALGTPAACAVVIGVQTEEDEVRRRVHGVESDLRDRGDRGEAPDGRESLKGGRSVMTPEEEGEALCNGAKSVMASEKRVSQLCGMVSR